MPILHFVEARVLIGGQPAAEFEVPDRPDDAHRAARYILAEPDLTYSVEVRFLPGFRLYQARYLYSKLQCDADNVGQAKSIYTRHIQQRRRIVTQNSLFSKFDAYPAEDKTTAQWYKYKYTFGLLERTEASVSDDLTVEQVLKLGSIHVTSYRARRTQNKEQFITGNLPLAVDKVPEKAMKGRDIKSSTQYHVDKPIQEPKWDRHNYSPIAGPHGAKLEFEFLYRSKHTLQSLGLLPRPPSPVRSHSLKPSPEDSHIQTRILEMERKLAELRAQARGRPDVKGRTLIKRRFSETNVEIKDEFASPAKKPTAVDEISDDDG